MILDYLMGTTAGGSGRASLENPAVSLSNPDAWRDTFGLGDRKSVV